MRASTNSVAFAAGVAALMLSTVAPAGATARQVVLQKTYSRLQLFQACKTSGGVPGNTGSPGTGYTTDHMDDNYSCTNIDKGTDVTCSPKTGKCVGTTPE